MLQDRWTFPPQLSAMGVSSGKGLGRSSNL